MIRVRRTGNRSLDMKAFSRKQSKITTANSKDSESVSGKWGGMDIKGSSSVCFPLLPLLHLLACLFSLFIGLRISREPGLTSYMQSYSLDSHVNGVGSILGESASASVMRSSHTMYRDFLFAQELREKHRRHSHGQIHDTTDESNVSSTRVGRHGILIREYPHPDPLKVVLASELLDLLQEEQHRRFSSSSYPLRPIIAITPTYCRTFQLVHMVHLANSLRMTRSPIVWIVIEAEEKTNETATILLESGIDFVHLTADVRFGSGTWQEREASEVKMREVGLRYVRAARLDGLVTFVDDSVVLARAFFDEAQKVKWIGAATVGINIQQEFGRMMAGLKGDKGGPLEFHKEQLKEIPDKRRKSPVQGPVCNSNGTLIGWHTYPHDPQEFIDGLPEYLIQGRTQYLIPRERPPMVWTSFVLNSRLLWGDVGTIVGTGGMGLEPVLNTRPSWVRMFEDWIGDEDDVEGNNGLTSGTDLLKRLVLDESLIEPLGECGTEVLAWWLKVEARWDSKHPSRWYIPGLPIVVPSKSTPWPKRRGVNDTDTVLPEEESSDESEKDEAASSTETVKEASLLSSHDKVSKAREALGNLQSFAEKQSEKGVGVREQDGNP